MSDHHLAKGLSLSSVLTLLIPEGNFLRSLSQEGLYRVKRSGPSTEPWGTPQERVENAEMESTLKASNEILQPYYLN